MEKYESIIKRVKYYIPIFVINMIFSGIIYALLLSERLVNSYDGLWEYSYHVAKGWELSLGRWFWLYIDQLRFGISIDPLTSLISLAIFSVGMIVLIDLFECQSKKASYAMSFLFLSNVVICISLSYRFMSPTFAIAFLLSVLSAGIIVKMKSHLGGIAIGATLLAFSMGAYQSYVGCTCVILIGYLLCSLLDDKKTFREILVLLGRSLASGILGGVLYVVILKLHLKVFSVAMSGYNGASGYTIKNTIVNLASSVKRTYEAFVQYFFGTYFLSNIFQKYKIFAILFVVIGIILCFKIIDLWKTNKAKGILFLALLLVMPIACGAILLVATNSDLSMQMTAGWGLCVPVLVAVVAKSKKENGFFNVSKILCQLILLLVLYGNIYQVTLDQNALMEGKIATTTLASDVVNRLGDEGCLSAELEYCVLGMPAGNPLFSVSELYSKANTYAKFGVWWLDSSCTRQSWNGVFNYLCGINLDVSSVATYNEIYLNEEVQKMPSYPEDGFIYRIDDVVVIKMAGY